VYPRVKDCFVIRGAEGDQYIVDTKKFRIIPLRDSLFVDIILACNGSNNVSRIAKKFDVNIDDLMGFLDLFISEEIIKMLPIKKHREITVKLCSQQPWLREVHLDITNRCNLANFCRHCFRGEKLNIGKVVDGHMWIGLIKELSNFGVYNVAISGGEPMLEKSLPNILKSIVKEEMLLGAIFTNGTIWSKIVEEVVAIIIDKNISTTFYISLDGPNRELHDKNRGRGSFDKTVSFIKKMVSIREKTGASYKISVNSLISSENFRDLAAWYDYLLGLRIDRWRLTSGRLVGNLKDNHFLVVGGESLFDEYVGLIRKHIIDRQAGSEMLLNVESFFNTNMLVDKTAYIFSGENVMCDYKQNACSVEPNGNVQFCTSWNKSFGNVFDIGIEKIWQSKEMQVMKNNPIKNISECLDCDLLEFCGGGCRLVAKDINSKDKQSCERYKMFVERILPILSDYGVKFINDRSEI